MTNEELIKALRHCSYPYRVDCSGCVYEPIYRCKEKMMRDAADALEAAEQRIAELEKEWEKAATIATEYEAQTYELQARIAELEAHLPKEGEWIDENRRTRSSKFVCSACKRTCYDIQPTRNKAWTKRCRYNYCPNCGARMKGEQE